jgi:hypothetical protein
LHTDTSCKLCADDTLQGNVLCTFTKGGTQLHDLPVGLQEVAAAIGGLAPAPIRVLPFIHVGHGLASLGVVT